MLEPERNGEEALIKVKPYRISLEETQRDLEPVPLHRVSLSPVHNSEAVRSSNPDCQSFVPLALKDRAGAFQEIGAVPLDQIDAVLAERAQLLETGAYVTLNTFYRGKPCKKPLLEGEGIISLQRKAGNLRWITCAWADLDFYKLNPSRTQGEIIGAIIDAQNDGKIPRFSYLQGSGRGLWIIWKILQPAAERHGRPWKLEPARAWKENLETWEKIQAGICDVFAPLGADPASRDPVRYHPLLGSRSPKDGAGEPWIIRQSGAKGEIVYSLEVLRRWFDPACLALRNGKPPKGLAELKTEEERKEDRRKGFRGMLQLREEQLRTLAGWRGGIPAGMRHLFLLTLSITWKARRIPDAERFRRLEEAFDRHIASYTDFPRSRIGSVMNCQHRITNQTISDWLDVTPEEYEKLQLLYGRNPRWQGLPPAARFQVKIKSRAEKREEEIEIRQTALKEILEKAGGEVLPIRELRSRLARAGFETSKNTIARDLDALGIERPRPGPRIGRKRKRVSLEPCFVAIELPDLQEPSRLARLYEDARKRGKVNGAEADRLFFFSAAQAALRKAQEGRIRNPAAAFRRIIEQELRPHVSQADEDRARAILRELS